ncbi:Hypothetical protein R9X50_00186000 [Acrodontium crateriforme]|uniref:Acyltransferase 3 domain-containing protein n=1 Tax=Acrodontium crateriforme TaxID=150365 RepID=A0AAQ3R860_9PEZI|nr:Hypothetical protein R9X50_00186000 [Acrodontium crateriforme]
MFSKGEDRRQPDDGMPDKRRHFAQSLSNATENSPHDDAQDYLMGVRGCLAIMSFLWVFLQTYVPGAVAHSANTVAPAYQSALQKSLSILFWNDSLIYSSIIFLSARMICLPFLLDSSKVVLASSVVRRGIRLWLPTAACLIVVYVVFTKNYAVSTPDGLQITYLEEFANATSNYAMPSNLTVLTNSLANFNAIFDVFWVTQDFRYQAANMAFPTQTLWIVSALFQQSYTVYTTMVIIPYTRKTWRLWGAAVFILTAWWVYSWAWFSITALLFADLVMNMNLQAKLQNHHILTTTIALLSLSAGYFMMFYWVAARPDLQFAEINFHTGPYNTGGIYTDNDTTAPMLRADNYLVIVGFYLLLEMSDVLQRVFRNPALVFLGKRSYGYFLLQSIIVYTLGIRLTLDRIRTDVDLSGYPAATGIAFASTLAVTFAAGEVFYWLIDLPTQQFAKMFFHWLRQ